MFVELLGGEFNVEEYGDNPGDYLQWMCDLSCSKFQHQQYYHYLHYQGVWRIRQCSRSITEDI